MTFEWDNRKNELNQLKHSISFEEAVSIFERPVLLQRDERNKYGEARYITHGELMIDDKKTVIIVVHTFRGENIRIISARKGNKQERGKYYEHVS